MIQILSWLVGWRAKAAVVAAGVLALVGLRAWDISTQQAKGAAKAMAKVEAKANENARKADEARRSVDRLPASGLLDRYVRD